MAMDPMQTGRPGIAGSPPLAERGLVGEGADYTVLCDCLGSGLEGIVAHGQDGGGRSGIG